MGQHLTFREVPIRPSLPFSPLAFNSIKIRPSLMWLQLPPLSFPKSSIPFSKAKQDVWLKFIQHMDVLYELVR